MFFGKENWFGNDSIRRYTALFGSVFNDIWIKRVDEETKKETMIKVPLRFGRGNLYEKIDQTSESREGPRVKQILPMLAFDIDEINYDASRKTNEFQKIKSPTIKEDMSRNWVPSPMPYTIKFTLYTKTKNLDDGLQIVEQIIPLFNTGLTIRCHDINQANVEIERDIVINMIGDIDIKDSYEEVYKEQREITIELKFEVDGYLYGRTRTNPIVLEADVLGLLTGDFTLTPIENLFSGSVYDTQPLSNEWQTNINNGDEFRQVELDVFGGLTQNQVQTATDTKITPKRKRK